MSTAPYPRLTLAEVRDLTAMHAGAPWGDPAAQDLHTILMIYDMLRAKGQRPVDPAREAQPSRFPMSDADLLKLEAWLQKWSHGEAMRSDEWRRLALQFDGHRMQALGHLKTLVQIDNGYEAAQAAEAFLAAPPLSGEAVLAQRIAELAQSQADDLDENAPWLTRAHILCTDMDIPPGHISERLESLRAKIAAQPPREILQQIGLHAAIMNLPCAIDPLYTASQARMYKIGHREARHAAAELAAGLQAAPIERASALERLHEITNGIDSDQCERDEGWWETSYEVEFGRRKLTELELLVSALAGAPVATVPAGYALISKDALRSWGRLDEVEAACAYSAARPAPAAVAVPAATALAEGALDSAFQHLHQGNTSEAMKSLIQARAALAAAPAQPDLRKHLRWALHLLRNDEGGCCGQRHSEAVHALERADAVAAWSQESAARAQAVAVPGKALPYEPTSDMLIAAREHDPSLPIETIRAIYWSMWRTAPAAPAQEHATQLASQDGEQDEGLAQAIDERDTAEGWADGLAGLIAAYFGQDIGEHSSAHNPWQEAKDIIEEAEPYRPAAAAPAQAQEDARTYAPIEPVSIIWHESPEAVDAAHWTPICESEGITLEELRQGHSIGVDEQGREHHFSQADVLQSMRDMGFWGFVDTKTRTIHAWADPATPDSDIMEFLGHEIGHVTGTPDEGDWEEERRADQYGGLVKMAHALLMTRPEAQEDARAVIASALAAHKMAVHCDVEGDPAALVDFLGLHGVRPGIARDEIDALADAICSALAARAAKGGAA